MYEFFQKNKSFGKKFTVNHFKEENVSVRTIYSNLERFEHLPLERKHGSGTKCEKMTKKKLCKLKKAFRYRPTYGLKNIKEE